MPRQSRLDAPVALHHIIARGNERRKIFEDKKDCEAFLVRLVRDLGLSMTSLAKSLSLSFAAIGQWGERGERQGYRMK